jgi:hypothetical protein
VKLLILALRHLARRPRRTILTTLTIAAATLCFAMLVAVPSSMNRIIDSASRGQRLIITNRTGPYGLPMRYCNDIKKIPHITGCVPQVFFYLRYRTDSDWIGVTASTPEVLSLFPDYRFAARDGRSDPVHQGETCRLGGLPPAQEISLEAGAAGRSAQRQ